VDDDASVGLVRWDEMREQFFGLLREVTDASGGRAPRPRWRDRRN
jgi:hypothetical protein